MAELPPRLPRCTGVSWHQISVDRGEWRRCRRRTSSEDQRCWQHHDQPIVVNPEAARQ